MHFVISMRFYKVFMMCVLLFKSYLYKCLQKQYGLIMCGAKHRRWWVCTCNITRHWTISKQWRASPSIPSFHRVVYIYIFSIELFIYLILTQPMSVLCIIVYLLSVIHQASESEYTSSAPACGGNTW